MASLAAWHSSWRSRILAELRRPWSEKLRPGSVERRRGWILLALALAIWAWVDVMPRAEVVVERPWEHQTDLTVYTEAGAAFFDGRPPYEVANIRGWRYLYPPLLAILLAPLQPLDPQYQALVWFALSALLCWGCLRETERLAGFCLDPGASKQERRVLVPTIVAGGFMVSLLPTLNCLQRGQLGVAKLYFLLLGFRLLCEARAWPRAIAGGVSLAFAVALKITPLLPAGLAVGQLLAQAWFRPKLEFARARAGGAVAGACLGLALFFVVVPSAFVGWQANVRHLGAWYRGVMLKASDTGHDDFAGNPHTLRNQSLSNAVYRLGNLIVHEFAGGPDDRRLDEHGYDPGVTPMDLPIVGQALGVTRLALLALLLVFSVQMGRRGDGVGQAAGFGLACVATLIVSPVARSHYFMLWLPAVIVAPIWLWRRRRRVAALVVALSPAVITWSYYLCMIPMGRAGLLGIGVTLWFIATISCILSTARKADTTLGLRQEPHFGLAHGSGKHITVA